MDVSVSTVLKMQAASSSEMLIPICQSTEHHIWEDCHYFENLIFHSNKLSRIKKATGSPRNILHLLASHIQKTIILVMIILSWCFICGTLQCTLCWCNERQCVTKISFWSLHWIVMKSKSRLLKDASVWLLHCWQLLLCDNPVMSANFIMLREMSNGKGKGKGWMKLGSGYIHSHFLDLDTSWRWVVSFTPLLLYPQGKNPWHQLDRRLGWAPEPVWTTWRGENSWPYQDSKSNPSVIQPLASHYTDYAIPAPLYVIWSFLNEFGSTASEVDIYVVIYSLII
jgi:hypothetical protein